MEEGGVGGGGEGRVEECGWDAVGRRKKRNKKNKE